jgi:hypothetical protein
MSLRRKQHSFIDFSKENKKTPICSNCNEYFGLEEKLVPRYITNDLGDNAKDNDFMICPRCGKIYSVKNELKFKSQIEPFTNLNEDREVRIFTPKSSRRRKIGESFNHKNNEEIPKLAGKEDTDLKALLRDRAGTINYINTENEGDDDRYY